MTEVALSHDDIVSALCNVLATDGVEHLEDSAAELERVDLQLKETMVGELYIREITIPAGTILTSKVWLSSYADIMISGKIAVATKEGVTVLEGYNLLRGKKGRKRCGYAYEDTKWVTVHKSAALTTDGLEDKMTVDSVAKFNDVTSAISALSFSGICSDFGIDEKLALEAIEDKSTFAPINDLSVYVADSKISGKGLFSNKEFQRGDFITIASQDGVRTEAGRYTNHSPVPNAMFVFKDGGNAIMIALDDIYPGDELTVDYRANIEQLRAIECQQR